jgi:hypothetical protein
MKNNAILKAGKTKPTIGTKIEKKMMLHIFIFKIIINKVSILQIDTIGFT